MAETIIKEVQVMPEGYNSFIMTIKNSFLEQEELISANKTNIDKMITTVDNLKSSINNVISSVERSISGAVKMANEKADLYKAGKPEGYDELVGTVRDLKVKQYENVIPFLLSIKGTGITKESWEAVNKKTDSLRSSFNGLSTVQTILTPVNVGIVAPNGGGTVIASVVEKGMSLIRVIYDNDIKATPLTGWWLQGEGYGSGMLSDSDNNVYVVMAKGARLFVKVAEGVAGTIEGEGDSMISDKEAKWLQEMAATTLTAEKYNQMASALSGSKASTLPVVSVGVVSENEGGSVIREKTANGLQTLKMTLGGVTIVGPWIREGTYGYGFLSDINGTVYSVRLNDDKIVTNQVATGGSLVSQSPVSADLDQIVSMMVNAEKTVSSVTGAESKIRDIENKMTVLEGLVGNVSKQGDLESLIKAVGTSDKIDGKSLLQIMFDIKRDIAALKAATGVGDTSVSTIEDTFNYRDIAMSRQHEILLRMVRTIALQSMSTMTGEALISQGLTMVTTKSLSNWKADFVTAATTTDINVFLNSFGINLTNTDVGNILGYDTGSGAVNTADDVILEDTTVELNYPTVDYTFDDDHFSGGSYTMRTSSRQNLQVFVQQPTELSATKQETMKKIVCWYVPSSIATIEKSIGLSFNSNTSELSNVVFGSDNSAIVFEKKAIIVAFDDWEGGFNTKEPSAAEPAAVTFPVMNESTKKATAVVLDINGNFYSSVTGNSGIGINGAPMALDRVICQYLVGAVLGTNVSNYDTLPLWFKEGIAALVYGGDDINTVNLEDLLKDSTRLEKALSVNSSDDYSSDGDNPHDATIIGYLFLRYVISEISKSGVSGVSHVSSNLPQAAINIRTMLSTMASSNLVSTTDILNRGIRSVGNQFSSFSNLKGEFLSDLQQSINNGEYYETFLRKKCGIILHNRDSGSIFGFDAGGDTSVTADSVVWEDSDIKISYPTNSMNMDDYKAYYKYFDNVLFLFPDKASLSDNEQFTLGLVASQHIPNALGMIKTLTGLSLEDKISKGMIRNTKQIVNTPFVFVTLDNRNISPYTLENDNLVRCNWTSSTGSGNPDILNLTIKTSCYGNLSRSDMSGVSVSQPKAPLLDIMILQELTRGVLAVNLKGGTYPLWFTEGIGKLIAGADDELAATFPDLLSSPTTFEAALNGTSLNSFVHKLDPAATGYVILRYFAKKTSGSDSYGF